MNKKTTVQLLKLTLRKKTFQKTILPTQERKVKQNQMLVVRPAV